MLLGCAAAAAMLIGACRMLAGVAKRTALMEERLTTRGARAKEVADQDALRMGNETG